jgi:guanine deaminase
MTTIIRARLAHTPRDPFLESGALETYEDGAVAFEDGTILATGAYPDVAAAHPDATVLDRRDCFLFPGLVDTHVHYPQVPVIGAMGLQLLDWLSQRTLPEEAKMADAGHARRTAQRFVRLLAQNGTTSALVFGSHVPDAQEALFEEADALGLRVASGLVISDRNLRPELEVTPERAYEASRDLLERWHGRGRIRYAVTPRFSVSCTEPMLDVCRVLLDETPSALFTSHVNESPGEIEFVSELAAHIPIIVISEMMGLDPAERDRM